MTTAVKCFALLAVLVVAVQADVYLHNPRGSNNRLDEQNRNRNNANRLFDSQNNNKGGYNVNAMDYYSGSLLPVEWTNQHSCGHQNNHCEIVIQYMCDDDQNGAGIRNGQIRNTIDPATPDDPQYGRHESYETYKRCVVRERNMGLFLADQNLNNNEDTAMYTRQNTNGQRSGLECAEERDYYPYWHPSDWMDIAVMTNDISRCDYYQTESQNVKAKNYCNGTKAPDPANPDLVLTGDMYNNEEACTDDGFDWVSQPAWNAGAPVTITEGPECLESPWSRDNHLGNGLNGYANTYQWTLPTVTAPVTCVLRLRYNISTGDYDGWNTFADMNGDNSPVEDNEDMDFGNGVNLRLNMNTDQHGRTFQDRSSTFTIKPRPAGIGQEATIYNLNVKGQRGNIVQNYPSVEYDYTPSSMTITTADYVHRQVTGSNTTPAGAGQGQESTDRHNFVQIDSMNHNYPTMLSKVTQIGDISPLSEEGFLMVKRWALLDQNDNEIDDASPHQDFGLVRYSNTGSIYYMNTRNNNFTNRSQKGSIEITDGQGLGVSTIIIISVAVAAGVLLPAALIAYGVARPSSKVGSIIRKPFGGSSSGLPDGYMGA